LGERKKKRIKTLHEGLRLIASYVEGNVVSKKGERSFRALRVGKKKGRDYIEDQNSLGKKQILLLPHPRNNSGEGGGGIWNM